MQDLLKIFLLSLEIQNVRQTRFLEIQITFHPSYLPDLSQCQSQVDISQNSSLSQITQKVTGMSVSRSDNCLSVQRRWRRQNTLRHFAVSLQQVSMYHTAGSTDVTMRLLQKLILQPPAQFSCCQLLITKLSVTIYISALYKPTTVSIDVITQWM